MFKMPEASSKFYALSACIFLLCLISFPPFVKAEESTVQFDTFACPTIELMESFAREGILQEHKVCSLLKWDESVDRSVEQKKLHAKYVGSLPGKSSRYAAWPKLYAVELQGRKLYAIKNPGFAEEWKSAVTLSLIPDYPYKTWMMIYWVVIV